MKLSTALAAALLAGTGGFAAPAAAVPVGLELALLTDVSGSISGSEYSIIKNGYAQAFQSAALQDAVFNSQLGSIAVTYIEFSGATQQAQQVGWTLINDAASANAFAAALLGAPRAFAGATEPGNALNFTVPLFADNGFEGLREVIDVVGDGNDSDTGGADTSDARDAALAAGIEQINGLIFLGEPGLTDFYQDNVVGGAGSFLIEVDSFDDFMPAIEDKLIREVTPTPEPAALALFGLGALALGLARRRG